MDNSMFDKTHRAVAVGVVVLSLTIAGFVVTYTVTSQSKSAVDKEEKNRLITKIQNSDDVSLRVIENEDAPLRIVEAKAKEIHASDYARLTGSSSPFERVSSVPRIVVKNRSTKTITEFMLFIRDPNTQTMRSLMLPKLSIPAGESYTVEPAFFVESEKTTTIDGNGFTTTIARARVESTKYWVDFAQRSAFFVSIGIVLFEDGTRWMVKEEGGIQ